MDARLAEREGFEPSIRFWRILTFQASAFDHSATAPHALESKRPSGTFHLPQGAAAWQVRAMIGIHSATESVTHTGALWRWTSGSAPAAWFFITIDGAAGEILAAAGLMRRLEGGQSRGFCSIKVAAQIGDTRWNTSAFPAKDAGGYMLPIKASVRKAEGIGEGDAVAVTLVY
jgi:hypothetical protein